MYLFFGMQRFYQLAYGCSHYIFSQGVIGNDFNTATIKAGIGIHKCYLYCKKVIQCCVLTFPGYFLAMKIIQGKGAWDVAKMLCDLQDLRNPLKQNLLTFYHLHPISQKYTFKYTGQVSCMAFIYAPVAGCIYSNNNK